MSDAVQIVSLILSAVTTCFLAYMAYATKKLNAKADEAAVSTAIVADKAQAVAVKVAEASAKADLVASVLAKNSAATAERLAEASVARQKVADDLSKHTDATSEKLNKLAVVAELTHGLVNNAMTVQMQVAAVALRKVADMTKHPDDQTAADLQDKALNEHLSRQKPADPEPKVQS